MRPYSAARSMASWMRCTELVKQQMKHTSWSGRAKDLIKTVAHRQLAAGMAAPVDVGAVGEQRQHALLPQFGEFVQVEGPVIGRRWVNFEVAGVNHGSGRGFDGDGARAHNTVGDVNVLHLKGADLEGLAGTDDMPRGDIEHVMLSQTRLDHGQGELTPVDRDGQFIQHVGQRTDMIFVRVRQKNGPYFGAVFDQKADVGDDDIDAQQLRFGKHQPRIDDDDVLA